MKILFPCHEKDNSKVDDHYMEEHHAAKLQGHDCYLFDYDAFAMLGEGLKSNIPTIDDEAPLVLRSQMLNLPDYENLYEILKEKGYLLINTPEQYKNCHHFPESYDYTKEYTSKAIFIKNWDAEILQNISDFFEGKDFLLKDYVKSEKSTPELFFMPGGISGEDLLDTVEKFVEKRGNLFSVGLVFKEFVDLKKYEGEINEWRLFFYNRRLISSYHNSNTKGLMNTEPTGGAIDFATAIAHEIDSNFFTIDIAEMKDGKWMIIETGDGQVCSFSPDQNCLEFFEAMLPQAKEK